MRIYFISSIPAALKLGGVYAGLLNKNEQFMNIDLSDNIFCEIIPADAKKLPVNFILDQSFLDNPPENIEVYDLKSCYKVSAINFYTPGGKLDIAYQTREGAENTLVTLFSEQGTKLMLENKHGFMYEDLPDGFEIKKCYHKYFMGEDLIVIEGSYTKNILLIVNEKTMKLVFKNAYESYSLEDTLELKFKFLDIAKHIAHSKWVILNGKFTMSSYEVSGSLDTATVPEKLLPYCFFEEILCGGNAKEFLSDALKAREEHLKKYLGEFIDVIPPPFNIDENYVGLIYRTAKNKYSAKYFKAQISAREVVNILPLELDN